MSYLVLARKWRPRQFSEMVGQEHVVRALVNALDNERLHHAFLFTGTRGVGKTTVARILAKAMNCETSVSSQPCGECDSCREIDEGRYIDLIEVDAASKTKVDDTRELLDNVQYAPTRGRYKVYLIDEVHMLSNHSFNALLKTLEEPPPHVKFLLATTNPKKLPVTVLSRCLQFNLKRLPVDLIEERLVSITAQENIEAEAAAIRLLAQAADGSMRDALSLLDQVIAFGGGNFTADDTRAMLGMLEQRHVLELLDELISGNGAGLMTKISAMDEYAPDYAGVLADLASLLQRVAVKQAVPDYAEDSDLDIEILQRFATAMTAEDTQLYYQIAVIGRRDLPLAPDPRAGFEMIMLRMLAFRPALSGEQDTLPAHKSSKPVANSRPAAAPTQRNSEQTAADTPEAAQWCEPDWPALVGELPISGAVKQLAAHCVYNKVKGNAIYLTLDADGEHFFTNQLKHKLGAALTKYFGEPLKLQIDIGVIGEETPAGRQRRILDERFESARQSIETDPNVQALKETFGATVDVDSIKPISD